MLNISSNGYLILNRGDTISVPLFINAGTEMHPVRYKIKNHPNDKIYLGIMEPNQIFENAIVRKVYTSESEVNEEGDLVISFNTKDTEYLHPGKYYYQIKLVQNNTEVTTIIPKTELYLC